MTSYKQSTLPVTNHIKVVEIMETVQGEGRFIGTPSVFFRTGMCNLRCPGCDTVWSTWDETHIDACAERIRAFKSQHVVFTGGEPTLWQSDLGELATRLFNRVITVETNGSVPITDEWLRSRVNLWSFSPKVGSLGHDEKFSHDVVLSNIRNTFGNHQIKYVLDPNIPEHVESVFEFQAKVDALFVPDDCIYFQPYDHGCVVNDFVRAEPFNDYNRYNNDLSKLTKLVLERSGSRFKVLPQLHKYIAWR